MVHKKQLLSPLTSIRVDGVLPLRTNRVINDIQDAHPFLRTSALHLTRNGILMFLLWHQRFIHFNAVGKVLSLALGMERFLMTLCWAALHLFAFITSNPYAVH